MSSNKENKASLTLGQRVDIVKGTYAGQKGVLTKVHKLKVTVDIIPNLGPKTIFQTSVVPSKNHPNETTTTHWTPLSTKDESNVTSNKGNVESNKRSHSTDNLTTDSVDTEASKQVDASFKQAAKGQHTKQGNAASKKGLQDVSYKKRATRRAPRRTHDGTMDVDTNVLVTQEHRVNAFGTRHRCEVASTKETFRPSPVVSRANQQVDPVATDGTEPSNLDGARTFGTTMHNTWKTKPYIPPKTSIDRTQESVEDGSLYEANRQKPSQLMRKDYLYETLRVPKTKSPRSPVITKTPRAPVSVKEESSVMPKKGRFENSKLRSSSVSLTTDSLDTDDSEEDSRELLDYLDRLDGHHMGTKRHSINGTNQSIQDKVKSLCFPNSGSLKTCPRSCLATSTCGTKDNATNASPHEASRQEPSKLMSKEYLYETLRVPKTKSPRSPVGATHQSQVSPTNATFRLSPVVSRGSHHTIPTKEMDQALQPVGDNKRKQPPLSSPAEIKIVPKKPKPAYTVEMEEARKNSEFYKGLQRLKTQAAYIIKQSEEEPCFSTRMDRALQPVDDNQRNQPPPNKGQPSPSSRAVYSNPFDRIRDGVSTWAKAQSIESILLQVRDTFPPKFGVTPHQYFDAYQQLPFRVQDFDSLQNAVKHLEKFLHRDSLPHDLDENQTFLCERLRKETRKRMGYHVHHKTRLEKR